MDRIGDTILYVGDRDAAESLQRRNDANITHIVTVDNSPLRWIKDDSVFKYLYHQCLDMEFEDLLSHFQKFFTFIDEAASNPDGKVLIHCFAGMSRSVTIATAYLMYSQKISAKTALKMIKESRGRVRPNDGFMRQLHIFNQMGGVVDDFCPVYRTYRLKQLAQNMQSGGVDIQESDLACEVDRSKNENYYKCMKCRRPLFRTSSLLVHTLGVGEAAFDWRGRLPSNQRQVDNVGDAGDEEEDAVCDKSLFIEPVQWMTGAINQLDGKLLCPKCHCKLGSFIWYGERCPCGAWVAPAFHIQSSKVDLVKPHPPVMMKQFQPGHVTQDGSTCQSNVDDITKLVNELPLG